MSEAIEANSTVSYTVKELLDEQTALLREIDKKVDQKADRADLVELASDLRATDLRVTALETDGAGRTAVSEHARRIWAGAGVLATILAMLIGGFVYNLTTTVHHP